MSETENVAGDELRAFIERIERLEEEKKTIADDIKEVYGEAKSRGYQTKPIRTIVSRRKRDRDELAEEDAMVSLYLQAMGEQIAMDLAA